MNWHEMLSREMDSAYRAAEGLMDLVPPESLDWTPSLGENWMPMGQLLQHMAQACGGRMKSLVTGKWTTSLDNEGSDGVTDLTMVLGVPSLVKARELLQEDRKLAMSMLAETPEDDLESKHVVAPWGISAQLGFHFLDAVKHLAQHKGQLYYYLKMQGQPVHTGNLWGV